MMLLNNDRMRSIIKLTCIVTVILIICGIFLEILQSRAWKEIRGLQNEFNFNKIENSLGQGLIIGVCGGFRNIVADISWMKVDHHWRKKESAATEAWIHTCITIDPRPKFFWINAARILALDMPSWEVKEHGGYNKIPKTVQDRIISTHAHKGLKILDEALTYHPDYHEFLTDKAHIYYRRLNDTETAAKLFLQASKTEDAPFYLNDIYVNLLLELNRKHDALKHLKSIQKLAPENFIDDINALIIELENKLNPANSK